MIFESFIASHIFQHFYFQNNNSEKPIETHNILESLMDESGSLQRFDNIRYEALQTLKSYQENILEKHKNDFIEKVSVT